MAQAALYFVVLGLPLLGLEILMGLNALKLDWQGWALAFMGPFLTVVGCEVYKFVSKAQINAFAERVKKQQLEEEAARLARYSEHNPDGTLKIQPPTQEEPKQAENPQDASASP